MKLYMILLYRGEGFIPTVYVSTTGNDSNDGKTSSTPKLTIGSAYNIVAEGGTINIGSGTYNETLTISKNIALASSGEKIFIQNLTMNGSGKVLTLSDTVNVTEVVALQEGSILSNGKLVLSSSASGTALIDDFSSGYSGTITGDIVSQRYISNSSTGYRYLSGAVTGANSSEFNANIVYEYNESSVSRNMNDGWQSYSGTISPLKSYNLFMNTTGTRTISLAGTANTGVYNTSITRQTPNGYQNYAAGFNAIGNPFPSPIIWTDLLALNSGLTTGSAYLFRTTELYRGQWASINSSGVGTNGATNEIASSQGFMVRKATAGTTTFTIDNSVRTNIYAQNANHVSRYASKSNLQLIRLRLQSGEYADECVIYAEQKASSDYDMGLDTEKLEGDKYGPSISIVMDGQTLSIDAVNELVQDAKYELMLRPGVNGPHTLFIPEINCDQKVYLIDREAQEVHDLSNPYTFSGDSEYQANRFAIQLGTRPELEEQPENTAIWVGGDRVLKITFEDVFSSSLVSVTDIHGKTMLKQSLAASKQAEVSLNNLSAGIYIISLQQQDKLISQKISLY